MLRLGCLPSDDNPMVPMLGEAEDFRALATLLRHFARRGAAVPLDTLTVCAVGGASVTLVPGAAGLGIARAGAALTWRLDPADARGFAAQLDALADPARLAGSEMLECRTEETIPVKASRGEYTADFLVRRDLPHPRVSLDGTSQMGPNRYTPR
ncbi:MAG: hypothetical protein P4L71_08755 [Acetobacteraceae bacterium]|nr:hypothetical protein [Acetobacteraceae bacterium]